MKQKMNKILMNKKRSNQIQVFQFKYQTGATNLLKYLIRMSNKLVIDTIKKIKPEAGPNKLFSTLGVITDSTNPYRKDIKRDYCMRLKVIDGSLNNEELTVFLFAKNIEDFPSTLAVGDILFLKNFAFSNEQGKLSCKKPFAALNTEFRFFSGKPEQAGYHPIDDNIGIDDENGIILNCITNLRKFSKNYFKTEKVPTYSKGGKNSSDFDLVLKVTGCDESATNSWKISLTDSKNNFNLLHNRPVKNGVYKVRSIANLSWTEKSCNLVGNDFTNFLEVADWMKSFQPANWDKLTPEKSVITVENEKLFTKILNRKRGAFPKETTLKELIRRESHSEDLRVKCEFYEVFTNFENALRKFDQENMVEKEYQHEHGRYIYNIHFAISDASMQGDIYNVYLYTYDGKGIEFLPGLGTEGIYGQNTLEYRQKYEHIVNRLLEETDENASLEIVISPMFNGRETIYRIVDTQLVL